MPSRRVVPFTCGSSEWVVPPLDSVTFPGAEHKLKAGHLSSGCRLPGAMAGWAGRETLQEVDGVASLRRA